MIVILLANRIKYTGVISKLQRPRSRKPRIKQLRAHHPVLIIEVAQIIVTKPLKISKPTIQN